jgi:large subunit ribosomal protein L10
MNRQEKAHVIESLKSNFSQSKASFLVNYKGLTVAELQELRKKLRANQGSFKVAKARLTKRAIADMHNVQTLIPYCKDQVGLVFAEKEMTVIAKTLADFAKEHKALAIVAGCCAEQGLLDANTIQFIATLPPREILLAQLCGMLKAPVASLAYVINLIKEQAEKNA